MTRNIFAKVVKDESGATAIEYGLIVALVAVGAMAAFEALGTSLTGLFKDDIATKLDDAVK